MIKCSQLGIGKLKLETVKVRLGKKNLILIKGKKGYIMCGYLDLKVAESFKDIAIKVTGVATVKDVLSGKVHSSTRAARILGVKKNQPIKDVLQIIA